jgi:hypothetical protein
MSTHGFRSLFMAASVAGAALGCYLVSLNVASERAKLEQVEARIVTTQRDIRVLQTEIGTRGRLAQLERWNANFIRLSAPNADQFLEGGFQLAAMVAPAPTPVIDAPIVYATVPSEQGVVRRPFTSDSEDSNAAVSPKAQPAETMLHVAKYDRPAVRVEASGTASYKKTPSKDSQTAATDPLAPLPSAKPSKAAAAQPKESGTPQ